MTFERGQRVLVSNIPRTMKFAGTVANVGVFREPHMQYAIDMDLYKGDYVFVGEDQLEKLEEENAK